MSKKEVENKKRIRVELIIVGDDTRIFINEVNENGEVSRYKNDTEGVIEKFKSIAKTIK